MGKTPRAVNKPTQNWERLQHLAHLWILTCSWQLSHCIWVIKTLPRHFNQPSWRRFPLPCSERVGWGEKTRHGGACGGDGGERQTGGREKPVFREGGPTFCLAICCSDEKSYTGGWQMDGMCPNSFNEKFDKFSTNLDPCSEFPS